MTHEGSGFDGRTALVTGAGRGIGRAVARRLAERGAHVVLVARTTADLERVAEELGPTRTTVLPMDVGKASSVTEALGRLERRVDILVSNAGLAASLPFERTDDAVFEELMAVNALGAFRLCRALIPRMIEADYGRVVLVASNAGLAGYAYSSAYCASKHALLGMMRAVALEIARTPVTLNAVCPGWVETEMADRAIARIAETTGRSPEQARRTLENMSPKRRMVEPDEVAHLVVCLCAEAARGIHGQAVALDGGQTMR
ncbi:MAG: SDR family oxidoreductase [Polyangiaceae bacterium]|nr:SDR family oxidoreductase [Polyangiaceae bacterium]